MICEICKRAVQLAFDDDVGTQPHHLSRKTFDASVTEDCMICVRLAETSGWTKFSRSAWSECQPESASKGFSRLRVVSRGYDDVDQSSQDISSRSFLIIVTIQLHGSEELLQSADFQLHHSSAVDYLQPHSPSKFHTPEDDSTDYCQRLVQNWFETCRSSHTKCNAHRSLSWFPSRLIDLTSFQEGHVRMILPRRGTFQGPYMTLSHRWGSKPSLQLTKDNEEDWLERGFEASNLPRTFKDAAELVLKLGVSYLWIDSLCIRQDCTRDWENESSQMGNIYKYSLCNIGATGTASEDEGLRYNKEPPNKEFTSLNVRVDSEVVPFYVIRSDLWEQLSKELLNTRAWVLQERQLSTSMVHFASAQLFWECYELNACQSFPRGIPKPYYSSTLRYYDLCPDDINTPHFDREEEEFDISDQRIRPLEIWHNLCRDYMDCDISRPEDKLVALSGLAKEFQKSIRAEYLAGLWDYHLGPQLLWEVNTVKERLSLYRAPSWSWASVEGRVERLMSYNVGGLQVEVITAKIESAGQDQTGAVASGLLKLRASLHAIRIRYVDENFVAEDVNGNNMWISLRFDTILSPEDLREIYFCMPVQCSYYECTKETGRPTLTGLILEAAGNDVKSYRRVGIFDEVEMERVTSAFRADSVIRNVITVI